MKPKVPLTQERVRELFDLDYEAGALTDKGQRRSSQTKAGRALGTPSKSHGYSMLTIDGKQYLLHRVIYLYVHGYMPEGPVDHINRDKLDNRPYNLREVSPSCNQRNVENCRNNTSGVKGVSWHKRRNKWGVYITAQYRVIYLGLYECFTEAVSHRLAAEQSLGWEGCDDDSPAYQYICKYIKGEV